MNRRINLIISMMFILCITSCSLFEKEEDKDKDISIISSFEDTEFSGHFTLDDETIPLTGAYVQITRNSVFNDIIINLAPSGSEGSVAFPGLGWVQFRFHTDVKTGNVIPTAMEYDFTVASDKDLDPLLFNGLYISPENESWKLQTNGKVLDNSIIYNDSDDYSFDFSFQSDAWWEREYGDSFVETKDGEINFTVSTSSSGNQSGGSGNSIVGTWQYQQANCGTSKAEMTFSKSSGKVYLPDCNNTGTCPTGSVTDFSYTLSSSEITFNYTKLTVCGETASTPKGGSVGYKLSGNQLTVGSQTWTRK